MPRQPARTCTTASYSVHTALGNVSARPSTNTLMRPVSTAGPHHAKSSQNRRCRPHQRVRRRPGRPVSQRRVDGVRRRRARSRRLARHRAALRRRRDARPSRRRARPCRRARRLAHRARRTDPAAGSGPLSSPLRTESFMRNLKPRQTEAERALLVEHDPLTGLPNRRIAVVALDLDDFARINDAYGHAEGDRAIRIIAERLTGCVRSGDIVARVGGDEFVVVFGDLASSGSAARAVQRMRAALAEHVVIGSTAVGFEASFGISCFPDDGGSAEQLIGFADLAMYRAKRTRRGEFAYFAPALHDAAVERLRLEHELGEAIQNGELVVHYQPIVDARTNRIGGVEALVRWAHPTLSLIHISEP